PTILAEFDASALAILPVTTAGQKRRGDPYDQEGIPRTQLHPPAGRGDPPPVGVCMLLSTAGTPGSGCSERCPAFPPPLPEALPPPSTCPAHCPGHPHPPECDVPLPSSVAESRRHIRPSPFDSESGGVSPGTGVLRPGTRLKSGLNRHGPPGHR